MTATRVSTKDLEFALKGLDADFIARLKDPARDPARVMPVFAEPIVSAPDTDLPSEDRIKDALDAHVCGGPDPSDLIAELLHPFVDPKSVFPAPGAGQKRPNYALEIPAHGLILPRAPTGEIARQLHEMASLISCLPIGKRAPQGAPVLTLLSSSTHTEMQIPAASIKALRQAYLAAFGRRPAAIHFPLKMTAQDVIPHVIAAREVLADATIGNSLLRERALRVIAAAEDLRAVAGVILRRHPDISAFEYVSVDIALDPAFTIEATDQRSDRSSSHGEMSFRARHRDLFEALLQVARRHPVLRELPDHCTISLRGDAHYLDVSIKNPDAPHHSDIRSISMLDYKNLQELAGLLGKLEAPKEQTEAHWRISLRKGHYRSRMTWDISGITLADALAQAVASSDISVSMVLFDLAIDLCADKDGNPTEIDAWRVFY